MLKAIAMFFDMIFRMFNTLDQSLRAVETVAESGAEAVQPLKTHAEAFNKRHSAIANANLAATLQDIADGKYGKVEPEPPATTNTTPQ